MLKKQMLAIFIVVLAVSGLGFAMKPAATPGLKYTEDRMQENQAVTAVDSVKDNTLTADAYINYDIIVFRGVAVRGSEINHAAFISIDTNDNVESVIDYRNRYNFMVIDGEVTKLELVDYTYDQHTKTALLTFSDESNDYTLIIRRNNGQSFMSGSFGEYELNMNMIHYRYPVIKKTLPIPEYEQDNAGITESEAEQIADSISKKIV
jgi:hypothetical protein